MKRSTAGGSLALLTVISIITEISVITKQKSRPATGAWVKPAYEGLGISGKKTRKPQDGGTQYRFESSCDSLAVVRCRSEGGKYDRTATAIETRMAVGLQGTIR